MNIAFVLPGKDFTKSFLESWTDMVAGCNREGINFIYGTGYSPVLHEVRNVCMGGRGINGKRQEPFSGWPYDYILFLDSDIVFNFHGLKKLLNHQKDIVSGWYPLQILSAKGERFISFGSWSNVGPFPQHFFTEKYIETNKPNFLVIADFIGLGFVLVKKGVFEKIDYPWFYPSPEEIESINKKSRTDIIDTIREDIIWAEKVTKSGFNIWVDTALRLGHEKRVIL